MQTLKPIFLVILLVLSSMSGCLSGEESEKESEEKIDVTGNNETVEQTSDVVAACSGDSINASACNVESVYGSGDELLAPVEFSAHHHSFDESHHPPGLDHKHDHSLEPPSFPDTIETATASTSGRSCSSAELVGLSPQDLVTYLVSSTDQCIYYFWTFNQEIQDTITDSNLQYVSNEIISLSATYQGDNTQGMHQLLFFLRVSLYHEYYQSGVSFSQQTLDATQLAAESLEDSQHILDEGNAARKILRQLIILTDTAGYGHEFIPLYQTILDTFIVQTTMDHYYSGSTVYSVFYSVARNVDRPDFNANQGLPDLLVRISEISLDTGDILIPNDDVWAVNWAIWSFARVAYTDAPDYYELGCQYVIDAENHHYDSSDYNQPFLWALNVHESFYGNGCINPDNDLSLDELLDDIEAQLFPNTFYFDNQRIIIKTPLETQDVEPLYYALKEVFSQFFRLSESKQPVANDPNYVVEIIIYGTRDAYRAYQPLLYGTSSNNGGIYVEQWGQIFTFEREESESIYTLEELLKHEYSHYLVGRHLSQGGWGEGEFYEEDRITWFNEGLAEYLSGSTKRDGVALRESIMNRINNDGAYRLTVQQVTESTYQSGFKFYRYSNLLIDYLIENQDWTVRSLMECMYLNDIDCYDNIVEQLLLQPDIELEYQAHIDDALLLLSTYGPPEAEYLPPDELNIVETYYVENRIRESRYGYDAECDYNIKTSLPRYRCIGTFHLNETTYLTTDKSWSLFNSQLDDMMNSMADNEDLNNLGDAVCWFDRILVEPTVREQFNHTTKWHCEVPITIDQYPAQNNFVEQMLEDISRTRANSTVECSESEDNQILCRIGVESVWFDSNTDQSEMIDNLHHYAREIANQIHAASPVLYGQISCSVSEDYEYQDVATDMMEVSSILGCQLTVN